jgi:hypothetical protein
MSTPWFPSLTQRCDNIAVPRGGFIPEVLTPLAFTTIYPELTEAQRRAYNRLHGLYFLEQTIFFEQVMGRPALHQLARKAPTQEIRREALEFAAEEDAHSAWFRALLRELRPGVYDCRDFDMLAAPAILRRLMSVAGRAVLWLPAQLWLQLIAEERAVYFGRLFLRDEEGVDARILEVQKRHLADEPAHIRRDELFLQWLWPATPAWLRRLNAAWLQWLLREFFHLPKRSGWRVVERWLAECPELLPRRDEFRAAMAGLADNEAYLRSLYPHDHLERTLTLAAPWPELNFLSEFFTTTPKP